MQVPQIFLAAICIVLGMAPVIGFRLLQTAIHMSPQGYGISLANTQSIDSGALRGIGAFHASALFVPLAVLGALSVMLLLAWLISRLGGAKRRIAEPWLCGYVREADCHRYVAHNFYGDIKRYFRWLGGMPRAPSQKDLP
jgi:hypothetical protein